MKFTLSENKAKRTLKISVYLLFFVASRVCHNGQLVEASDSKYKNSQVGCFDAN